MIEMNIKLICVRIFLVGFCVGGLLTAETAYERGQAVADKKYETVKEWETECAEIIDAYMNEVAVHVKKVEQAVAAKTMKQATSKTQRDTIKNDVKMVNDELEDPEHLNNKKPETPKLTKTSTALKAFWPAKLPFPVSVSH